MDGDTPVDRFGWRVAHRMISAFKFHTDAGADPHVIADYLHRAIPARCGVLLPSDQMARMIPQGRLSHQPT
jgi:hypothetical protein